MSNAVFPSLPGLAWNVKKTLVSNTIVTTSANLKETRVALAVNPVYEFELPYNLLRDDPSDSARLIGGATELEYLQGFINARQGSFDSFLYLDPRDNTAAGESCRPATGDGSNKLFQLARALGGNGFSEDIQNVKGSASIYVASTLQGSGYTVSDTGLVTFDTAPASGAAVQWSGQFYFRCRFSSDSSEFTFFSTGMWSSSSIKFRSVKL